MGAWGTGNFDNDTALDWVFELEETSDLSLIEETIKVVLDEEYIDSDIGAEALMAIEAIARLKGEFGVEDSYAEDLDNWVRSHKLDVTNEWVEKAKNALDLIVSEKSELYELWEDTDDFEAWKNEIYALSARLN